MLTHILSKIRAFVLRRPRPASSQKFIVDPLQNHPARPTRSKGDRQ